MDREQAINSLGLDQSCSNEHIQEVLNKLKSDCQNNINQCDDDAAKREYEEQLDILDKIAKVLPSEKTYTPMTCPSVSEREKAPPIKSELRSLSQTQFRDLPVSITNSKSISYSSVVQETPDLASNAGPSAKAEFPSTAQADTTPKNISDTAPTTNTSDSFKHLSQLLSDRYNLGHEIGRGGMGIVYLAFDRIRGEEIAIKCLAPHLTADEKARQRFAEEASLASKFSHKNVVRMLEVGQIGDLSFLTMELLKGRSLRDEIDHRKNSQKRFSVEEVKSIGLQLCEALSYAHNQQVVHRDVKPENVWICDDGTVKLMDFGIARLLSPSRMLTTNMALGTAYYMAPEQLRADPDIDHRADQFSLAVVLYELLTEQIPQGAIKPPAVLRKNLPRPLSDAVMKGLSGPPAERYKNITDFSRDLLRNSRRMQPFARVTIAVLCIVAVCASPWLWKPLKWQLFYAMAGQLPEQAESTQRLALAAKNELELLGNKAEFTPPSTLFSMKESNRDFDNGVKQLELQEYASAITSFEKATKGYENSLSIGRQWVQDMTRQQEAANGALTLANSAKENWEQFFNEYNISEPTILDSVTRSNSKIVSGRNHLDSHDFLLAKQAFDDASEEYKNSLIAGRRWVETMTQQREAANDALKLANSAKENWELFFAKHKISESTLLDSVTKSNLKIASARAFLDSHDYLSAKKAFDDAAKELENALIEGEQWRMERERQKLAAESAQGSMESSRIEWDSLVSKSSLDEQLFPEEIANAVLLREKAIAFMDADKFQEAASAFDESRNFYRNGIKQAQLRDQAKLHAEEVFAQYGAIAKVLSTIGGYEPACGKKGIEELNKSNTLTGTDSIDGFARSEKLLQEAIELTNKSIRSIVSKSTAKLKSSISSLEKKRKLNSERIIALEKSIQTPNAYPADKYLKGHYIEEIDHRRAIESDYGDMVDLLYVELEHCEKLVADDNWEEAIAHLNSHQSDSADLEKRWLKLEETLKEMKNTREKEAEEFRQKIKQAKDIDEGEELITRAIELAPTNVRYWLDRAQCYSIKKEFDLALSDINEALRLEPNQKAPIVAVRASLYLAKDDLDSAMSDCNEAIRLDPQVSIAWQNRAEIYFIQREYDNAVRDLEKAIQLDPNGSRLEGKLETYRFVRDNQ